MLDPPHTHTRHTQSNDGKCVSEGCGCEKWRMLKAAVSRRILTWAYEEAGVAPIVHLVSHLFIHLSVVFLIHIDWHGNLLSNFHPLGRAVYFYFSAVRLSSSVYVFFFFNMSNAINVRGNKKVYPQVCNNFLTIPITLTMKIFKNHTTECLDIRR